jgi:hypothetical protein
VNGPGFWRFDGETYEPERDRERLGAQLLAVRYLMLDHEWHTLADLARYAGGSEASVSARLRDLRKRRFGGYVIEREYVSRGLWRYRMPRVVVNANA